MNLAWANRLDQDELIAIQNSWQLDKLHELLIDLKKEQERLELSSEMYDKPNWDYRQADRNGYIRALSNIMKLTDPDQRKSKLLK